MGTAGCKRRSSDPHHHLLLHLAMYMFLTVLLQTASVASANLNYTKYRQVSSLRMERIQRHLHKINKPPVLSIEVKTECLPLYKRYIIFLSVFIKQWFNLLLYVAEPRWGCD